MDFKDESRNYPMSNVFKLQRTNDSTKCSVGVPLSSRAAVPHAAVRAAGARGAGLPSRCMWRYVCWDTLGPMGA